MEAVSPRPPAPASRLLSMQLVDRYVLAAAARPFLAALLIVLVALLLERILRLFDMMEAQGGSFSAVLELTANLVPHYLGLALPASFFVAVFLVAGRLSEDNEVDAMMASGISLVRLIKPLIAAGVLFAVFSVALFGFIQPYSRYAYRSVLYTTTNAGWDARAQADTFVDAPKGLVLSADGVDATGRRLKNVFLRETVPGGERVTTAAEGLLDPRQEKGRLTLVLRDGRSIEDLGDGRARSWTFGVLTTRITFALDAAPFRARGEDEREMTIPELFAGLHDPESTSSHARYASEIWARLVRAATLPVLPLLALPMALAGKRQRRTSGLIIAVILLLAYHHALQFGESLADTGRVSPLLSIGGPFVVFSAFCTWLFVRSRKRPGETPFSGAVAVLDVGLSGIGRAVAALVRRRRTEPSS